MASKQTVINNPAARTERLLVETVGTETVIFDLETRASHALKPLASAVYAYADGSNSVAEIAELASYRLATPVTEADVTEVVELLDGLDLLENHQLETTRSGFSRRDALKTFAAVGAGAALITTVSASTALASTTGQTALGNDQLCPTYYAAGMTPNSGVNTNSFFPVPGTTSQSLGGTNYTGLGSSNAGWSGNVPNSHTVYAGTCAYVAYNSSTRKYSKVTNGEWQCVPCDGTDNYQCCSVVCAPAGLGYKWGPAAESAGLGGTGNPPSPYLPYEGCGFNEGDKTGSCPSPGSPDYTSVPYRGKYCTDAECTHDGTCKS
jgi:hypothetical protein